LNDVLQELSDGRGDNNESCTIELTVKGFNGQKYVSDSSTVSFVKKRNGWFCFICQSPIKQVSQNQLFLHIIKNHRPPTLSLEKKSDIKSNKKQASLQNCFTKKVIFPEKHSRVTSQSRA
jgi:hypothetical protein